MKQGTRPILPNPCSEPVPVDPPGTERSSLDVTVRGHPSCSATTPISHSILFSPPPLNHTTSAASTGSPLPLGPCEPLNTSSAGVAGSKKRDGFCRPDFLPTAGGAELPRIHTRFRLRNGVAFPRRRMRDPGAYGMTHPPAAGSGTRITGFADRQRSASDVWRIDHERRLPRNPSDPSRHALVRKSDGAPVRHS